MSNLIKRISLIATRS